MPSANSEKCYQNVFGCHPLSTYDQFAFCCFCLLGNADVGVDQTATYIATALRQTQALQECKCSMRHLGSYPYNMSVFIEETCMVGHGNGHFTVACCATGRRTSTASLGPIRERALAGFQASILVLIPLVLETSYCVLYA